METAKGANRKIKNQAEYSGPSWNLARNTSEIVWGKSYCFVIFVKKNFKKNFQNNFQKSILLFHLKDLLQELQLGSLKVLDVLHAYQWKALESNEKLNNIVWVRNIINFISQLAHFIAILTFIDFPTNIITKYTTLYCWFEFARKIYTYLFLVYRRSRSLGSNFRCIAKWSKRSSTWHSFKCQRMQFCAKLWQYSRYILMHYNYPLNVIIFKFFLT